jgi:hypothetical protein
MKMRVSLVLFPLAAIALSGCAAITEPSAKRYEIDKQYVAAVERGARHMPVKVVWVNPPEKKVERK